MKTIKDVMTSDVVWVSPTAKVKTAEILLKGHGIDALPVVYSHDSVVGMVYYPNLVGKDPAATVMDVMEKDYKSVPPDMPVYQVAPLMKDGTSHVLVVDSGGLLGIVSRSDIILELGKSYDTLTKLPWQDEFRNWSIDALDRGLEISIILIDLNEFGKFNKKYGHVIGDNVLKAVGEVLKEEVDSERDFLCRYAGDEFAVASYRKSGDASELGLRLIDRISKIELTGLPEQITAAFGVAGGRRSGGREQIHSASTLDDLITNASLNCTLSKPKAATQPEPAPQQQYAPAQEVYRSAQPTVMAPQAPVRETEETRTPMRFVQDQARVKLQTVRVSTTPSEAVVEVILMRGNEEYSHSASGFSIGGRSMLRLVAEVTAGTALRSLAPGYGISVDDVALYQSGDGKEVVTVIATFITPRESTSHAGSAIVRHGDPYRASAAAMLSAINRLMELVPKSQRA